MARQLRIDFDGAWHHVMNRGAARERVFDTRRDGEQFEQLLGEASDRCGVVVHAYCLMSNHFHLLLQSVTGELSSFMQHVGRSYTQFRNTRLGRDGAVFRGRFHSELVDSDAYVLAASRYIHRNPSDIRPAVPLDRYRWSSYRAYSGAAPPPSWLQTDLLERFFGGSAALCAAVDAPSTDLDPYAFLRALRFAIIEHADDAPPPAPARLLATAAIDRLTDDNATRLSKALGFTSDGARRTALSRARQRLQAEPALDQIIERALRLAA
jgi:REP element-mobilizing transposase RayT